MDGLQWNYMAIHGLQRMNPNDFVSMFCSFNNQLQNKTELIVKSWSKHLWTFIGCLVCVKAKWTFLCDVSAVLAVSVLARAFSWEIWFLISFPSADLVLVDGLLKPAQASFKRLKHCRGCVSYHQHRTAHRTWAGKICLRSDQLKQWQKLSNRLLLSSLALECILKAPAL